MRPTQAGAHRFATSNSPVCAEVVGNSLLTTPPADSFERMLELQGIDHVALAVRDVALSTRWYTEVLGFERRYEGMWDGVPVFVGKNSTALALFPARKEAQPLDSRGRSGGMLHLAFRATRAELLCAQEDLKARGIEYSFEDHQISCSIYFRDPDGIELEITTYEIPD